MGSRLKQHLFTSIPVCIITVRIRVGVNFFFPMVPDSLGIVVEGAPPDQTFSHNVISTAHQNFLAALSVWVLLEISPGGKCFDCNFKHECFRCEIQHPAMQCTVPSRQWSITSQLTNLSSHSTLFCPLSTSVSLQLFKAYLDGYPAWLT